MRSKKVLPVLVVLAVCIFGFPIFADASTQTVATVSIQHSHSGNSTSGGGCYSTAIPHVHIGNETNGGGCYGTPYQTSTQVYKEVNLAPDWRCGSCHCNWNVGYGTCGCGYTGYADNYNFGKKEWKWVTETVTRYRLSCTKTIDGYSLGCGLDADATIGSISMTKAVSSEYKLSIVSEQTSDKFVVTGYKWSDNSTGSSMKVTANGVYTCTVSYTDNGSARTSVLSYEVTDYDTEPPVIGSATVSPTVRTNEDVTVTVVATDNMTVGGYSFDDGVSWQDNNSITKFENCELKVRAKDVVGNVSEVYDVAISNIDKEAPEVDNILQEIGKF